MPTPASHPFTLLVPVKAWATAKSRLAGTSHDRADLMRAFARDTVAAALDCPLVARVYVVTDAPEAAGWGAEVLPDEGDGDLNRALVAAEDRVRASSGGQHVAALLADLPCLRPDDLAGGLVQPHDTTGGATGPGRWFVPDASGTGTTLLAAVGVPLRPAFGAGSAARHEASGAWRREDVGAGLRRDVDTAEDLAAAIALGVGPHTRALLA